MGNPHGIGLKALKAAGVISQTTDGIETINIDDRTINGELLRSRSVQLSIVVDMLDKFIDEELTNQFTLWYKSVHEEVMSRTHGEF